MKTRYNHRPTESELFGTKKGTRTAFFPFLQSFLTNTGIAFRQVRSGSDRETPLRNSREKTIDEVMLSFAYSPVGGRDALIHCSRMLLQHTLAPMEMGGWQWVIPPAIPLPWRGLP